LSESPSLHFASFIVLDKAQGPEAEGSARLLGETTLDLTPIVGQLTDVLGVGIRQNLAFFRLKSGAAAGGNKEVVVGKFSVLLKIVADYLSGTQSSFDGKNLTGPRKAKSQVHPLPVEEPNYKWRVRVDLR